MTNLSSLTGFSGGGGSGGSGDLPVLLTQSMTLVDSSTGNWSNPSDTNQTSQSSTTYQSYNQLSTDGVFAGIFDPYNASNNTSSVRYNSFKINPSNGSIGNINSTEAWGHGNGDAFSTCHYGAVGMMVMNCGHHMSPSYGNTRKGYVWAGSSNDDGTVENTNHCEGAWENWPHSNGGLIVGATAAGSGGTMYGRRSGYNQNTGQYNYNNHYFTWGSSAGRQEWGGSSSTSTNYAWPCAKQSKDDLTPGGMIMFYDGSGNQTASCIYGSGNDRGSNNQTIGERHWSSQEPAFHLSNGEYLFPFSKGVVIGSAGGALSELNTAPVNFGYLRMIQNTDRMQQHCVPCKEDDTWIAPVGNSLGWMKFHIDVNDNYKVTILKQFYAFGTTGSTSVPVSGTCWGLVGSNDEYFVRCTTESCQTNIYTYNNPFAS
tara:strand:- start:1145 stop:2428 length:1284 start_codon:yes stop_codon:yes gene_type:complete